MMVWGWLLFAWARGAGTSPCDGRNGELVVEGSTSVLGKFICYDIYMLEYSKTIRTLQQEHTIGLKMSAGCVVFCTVQYST